jgi:hypothetical protein
LFIFFINNNNNNINNNKNNNNNNSDNNNNSNNNLNIGRNKSPDLGIWDGRGTLISVSRYVSMIDYYDK